MTVVMAALVGVLFAVGTYLLLQRALTRVILGIALLGHGANVLLLAAGGRAGRPAFVGDEGVPPLTGPGHAPGADPSQLATVDPLPQALALTAIVISFGVIAFLLALAYRSWVLHREDLVADDVEDRRIARLAAGGAGGGRDPSASSAATSPPAPHPRGPA